MKILFDMNIPLKYAAMLMERGIESLRWSDVGSPYATDDEIKKGLMLHISIFPMK